MGCNTWGVALGNFDGVHLGHRALLTRLLAKKSENNIKTMVFTFKQHPQNILLTGNKIPLIYPPNVKKDIMKDLGIDAVEMVDFNRQLSEMEPEHFWEGYLLQRYNIEYAVVGFNYRFGKGGKGDTRLIKEIGEKKGFEVQVIDPVVIDGQIVSSSLVRRFLSIGDIINVNRCLGKNYSVKAKVTKGDGRGSKIGFPTANICLPEDILYPAKGVYITIAHFGQKAYPSITNVGIHPTFSGDRMLIETHVPGFEGNIYCKDIEVEFLDRIRNEIKFAKKEELIKQIGLDLKIMQDYFNLYKRI